MAWLNLSHTHATPVLFSVCQPGRIFGYYMQRGISKSSDNYYDILGLNRKASQSQIKSAYYRLSKLYHPDVATDTHNAKEKFTNLTTAYKVLSNAHKRALYDRSLPVNVTSSIRHNSDYSDIDIEYREFLRRRGTFRSRINVDPQAAFTRRQRSHDDFYNQYYRTAMKHNWEAAKRFDKQQQNEYQETANRRLFVTVLFMGTGIALYEYFHIMDR